MRRRLLPAILLLVSLSSGAAAIKAEAGTGGVVQVDPQTASVAVAAPVLSPRRIPAIIAGPIGERRLAASLEDLWQSGPPDSCLIVRDGHRVLFERRPDVALIPASNMKLVTAAAVLAHLDPGERLRTMVAGTPLRPGGVVDGDLYLVGGGDPVLGTRAWAEHFTRQPALYTPLEVLADRVRDAGVVEVRGRVVGDDGRYDRVHHVLTWRARYVTDNETGPLSALTVNDGFERWKPYHRFADPAAGAAAVFNELLRQRGITVHGDPAAGGTPPGVVEHAAIESPSVAELVGQLVRESDNGTAELLVKELGLRVAGEGSTTAGTRLVVETVAAAGLPLSGLRVADGSGLDRGNRLTCRLLVDILQQAEPGDPLDAGLPVAGASGTLTRRFVDSPVEGRLRAKTGSINGVASLAGVVRPRGGRDLTFAYIVNGTIGAREARALQDELAHRLVRHPDVPALEELGPGGTAARS